MFFGMCTTQVDSQRFNKFLPDVLKSQEFLYVLSVAIVFELPQRRDVDRLKPPSPKFLVSPPKRV